MAKVYEQVEVRRGDLWYANLPKDRTGSEQQGERPCCICQAEKGLNSPVLTVAPVSASIKERKYPFLQDIDSIKSSQIHYEQLITIDRRLLTRRIGRLGKNELAEMDLRLAVPIGLSMTSYLHIKNIEVTEIHSLGGGGHLYICKVVTEFFVQSFKFTTRKFLDYFGEEYAYLLQSDRFTISEFLETLNGLKFFYSLVR